VLSEAPPPSSKVAAAEPVPTPVKTKAKARTKAVPKKAPVLPEPPAETSPGYA